jgi:hypothetical protein
MIIHLSLFAIADQRTHQTRAFRMAQEPRSPFAGPRHGGLVPKAGFSAMTVNSTG